MKLVQRVHHGSSKIGKMHLHIFSPKCSMIIPLLKEYFPFSQIEPIGYDNSEKEGTGN